jgi:hypothetical protein
MDRWRMLVAIQDDDDNSPWFDDYRWYRDCRFEPDRGWTVPPERRADFIHLGLRVSGGAP